MASSRIDFQAWLKLQYDMTLEEFSKLYNYERQKIYDEYEQETRDPKLGGIPGWIC